ncbi:MAG: hypothetical protein M3352_06385 [Bacteroidota bacterium]|nr:hypothetical protein [Bacteroidota bacterium]
MNKEKYLLLLNMHNPAIIQVAAQNGIAQSVRIKAFLPHWHHAVVQLTIDGKLDHKDSIHK